MNRPTHQAFETNGCVRGRTVFSQAVFLALLVAASTVVAGSKSQAIKNTVAVANTCVVRTADNLNFGNYVPYNVGDLLASGNIDLTCTKGAVASAAPVSGGTHLIGPTGSLAYALYTDPAKSKVWGAAETVQASVNFNGNPTMYFTGSQSGVVSRNACSSLAAGSIYMYWDPANGGAMAGTCHYGYTSWTAPQNVKAAASSTGVGIATSSGAILRAKDISTFGTVYLPSGATGSNLNYSFPVVTAGVSLLVGTAGSSAAPLRLPFYGRVPAGQNVGIGAYLDTVVFRVTF